MKVDKFQGYSLGAKGSSHAQELNATAKTVSYLSAPIQDTVSFSGLVKPLNLSEAAKTFIDYFPEGEARAAKAMTRVKEFAEGEAAGIGITAVGTGLVAPWPIAYNPIVDYQLKKRGATPEEVEEKHKTQKYSAWRQPVSAVLAVIFQLGVQKPIQIILENATNNPDTAKKFNGTIYNQAFLNNEKYLERQIENELTTGGFLGFFRKPNEEKIKGIEITEHSVDEAGNKIATKRPARTLEEAVKQEKLNKLSTQIEEMAKALKSIKPGDTEIKVGENIIPTKALAESINYQIEDHINFAEGLKKKDLEDYVDKSRQLIANEDNVRNILSKENIETNIQRIMDENPKLNGNRPAALRAYIREQKNAFEAANNDDMAKVLGRILKKCDKVIESSCARTVDRIDKIKRACGGTYSPGAYFEFMYSQRNVLINKKIDELSKLLIPEEQWGTIKPEELKTRLEEIAKACYYRADDKAAKQTFKDKGIFLSNKEKLRNLVYENVIKKGYKEVVKHKSKVSAQIVKASIATFIMLPITCTALNWVYPRFMDFFLPSLSGKNDKEQEVAQDGGANA